METIRNHPIIKNIKQIQNFRRNTGDLKNSKENLEYNFTFQKDADQQKEQVFVIYVWTNNYLSLNIKETTFWTKEMNLSLSVDRKANLSLWTAKPDQCVESVRVRSFFLVRIFPVFRLNMENYRVSPCIHSKFGVMRATPTPNANNFHAVGVRTLLRYFNTIVL